jgi:cytosolic prostaglandin-E synthase
MAAFGDATATAPCKWAQRTETLYLTINVADVTDEKIDVTETSLSFSGKSNGTSYSVAFDFFKPIELEGSIWKVLPNSIQMKLVKKDQEDEFWTRLTNDKLKEKSFASIDWDKYVDEDEQDGDFDESNLAGGQGMGGPGGMGGMPGMGGPGGMDMASMMQGMGGMGGMPGGGAPGGPGGAGGMDMAAMQQMMAQMGGGAPGADGGAGGMDPAALQAMMAQMGGAGGMPGMGGDDDEADSDDDEESMPDLESA